MFKLLTSLSFLYLLVIVVLVLYGFLYYRDFTKGRYHRNRFPVVFFIIGAACFGFLWINVHAPLRLETFSNLDHHFIRQDGFLVTSKIELGHSDTSLNETNSFSRFVFAKKEGQVVVSSSYAEEPFYIEGDRGYRLLSANYPAEGHAVSFLTDGMQASIRMNAGDKVELKIGDAVFNRTLVIKKAISAWNIFRDDDNFINSAFYNNEKLTGSLKAVLLLRDDVSRKGGGALKFFLSGKLFRYAGPVKYDEAVQAPASLAFSGPLPDKSRIAWGIGFLDNNRNQFRVNYAGADSFLLQHRYPVSYPLAEEDRGDWTAHRVTKFLVSDHRDMNAIPPVFKEGFLFPFAGKNEAFGFSPVLLSFQKAAKNDSLLLRMQPLYGKQEAIDVNGELLLSSGNAGFSWMFSIRNTYDWEYEGYVLPAGNWQALLFGSLGIFFMLVFLSSYARPDGSYGWIWQLLSCIVIVLLTTRFLLYWRYKSFPPYEGMDLPSQQQFYSFSNFGVIIFAAVVLGVIFGFPVLKYSWDLLRKRMAGLLGKPSAARRPANSFAAGFSSIKNSLSQGSSSSKRKWFFASWALLLIAEGTVAAINHFDPGVCRRLAIGSTLVYFGYLYFSYKYSPLVASEKENWWRIGTGSIADLVINNPVKVILSLTQLFVFVFIDIGFAIVFLNFLLFNEAFLCINYAIAGLSAGSRKNSFVFGMAGAIYMLVFILNLLFAPFLFSSLLNMPQALYVAGYGLFAAGLSYLLLRLLSHVSMRQKMLIGLASAVCLFLAAFFFFPKERILDKAAMTKYRIDVLTTPVDKAIAGAYREGRTYEPVIRAAQNQWFINTFIDEDNNPFVRSAGFNLLPHAPQNKGAKYNAQATDLVTSRFLMAEHGRWAILFYALLLLLPSILLSAFYKLYPDFTNRTNTGYPAVVTGFSIFNYLLITALLVILAATGRYIFFGQDLPFGSILSKQSILFPAILLLIIAMLFKNSQQQYYANSKKAWPGIIVFSLLFILLFFVRPGFNKNREFGVEDLVSQMDSYVESRLQPMLDHFDTSRSTRRLAVSKKDQLFSDSLRKLIAAGWMDKENRFFASEINAYARAGFSRHLDQRRMLYLDLTGGSPRLAVNENYFRVEPPPHLQQLWKGNVLGDSSVYNIALWNAGNGSVRSYRLSNYTDEPDLYIEKQWQLSFRSPLAENSYRDLYLINRSAAATEVKGHHRIVSLQPGDSIKLDNPSRLRLVDPSSENEQVLTVEPDAFMKNYFVNGSRYYVYPMENRFIWARNFAEAVSSDYSAAGRPGKNAFVSFDFELMDSLSAKIESMMMKDTAYKNGSEYGICIADDRGRLIALADFVKGMARPDPNNKAAFRKVIAGENGFVSQSLLRKQIGNINLLRMNPGPGSTFKPVVFSAIASQLNWDWDAFAAEGFLEKQHYFGGEKVSEYDFEKNNGRINNVVDYLKYSDNYYHSNVLLLGSYPKQDPSRMLSSFFSQKNPGPGLHWPYFTYTGKQYWLNGFENWPGYSNRKADFGMDSSFTSAGLFNNYAIRIHDAGKSFEPFGSVYDSLLFLNASAHSGFILPEYAVFDQRGEQVNHGIPYDLFASCFRGHVKGSSQVLVPPSKMLEAYGRLVTQSRSYKLTLNPYAVSPEFAAFRVDNSIPYNHYLSVMRESVFKGMKEALFAGTAARLGSLLKNGEPYFYYAKTGTTGNDELKTKSKLLALVISAKDIAAPGFNFRNNKFYTIYFTSQNGPVKQNEEFQAEIIRLIQRSPVFKKYMHSP